MLQVGIKLLDDLADDTTTPSDEGTMFILAEVEYSPYHVLLKKNAWSMYSLIQNAIADGKLDMTQSRWQRLLSLKCYCFRHMNQQEWGMITTGTLHNSSAVEMQIY